MRYNAFFGELPINAFKPRAGGGMTLHGGGNPLSVVTDAIENVVSGVGDVVSGVAEAVSDVGSQVDDLVNKIPGGWTTAALLAGGYYYAPEISAYLNATTGATVPLSEVIGESAIATPVTTGNVIANALPSLAPEVIAPAVASTLAASTIPEALSPVVQGLNATTALSEIAPVVAETAAAGGIGSTLGQIAPILGGAAAGTLTGSALGDMLAVNAGAGVVGSLISSNAATNAADVQTAAADRAIAAQQKNFETINAQQAPYRATGYNALNDIAALTTGQTPQYDANGNVVKDANGNPVMTTGSGYLQHQFDANDLKAGLAPNYDFMLGQGQMANQRAANMGGGALGGNALQGLNKFTQDYAGNAYQTAFNNYQTQRGNIYNTLAGIAGIGQTGQTATNTAATNATNATTQLGVGAAGANAAGTVGSANAYSNALGNIANNYTLASLLNQRGNVAMPV
jgi:hypothetical protein